MKPILSVIIPAYNCESYIRECLDSVLAQQRDDVEIVAVDDGSTDGTLAILNEYRFDKRIKVVEATHKGASGARNTGIENAEGKYITFLDCDDKLQKGFLKEGIELAEGDDDLYIFGIERVYDSGNSEYWTVTDERYASLSDFADTYIRKRQMLVYSNCNKFYRRSIIEENNIRFDPDIKFGEDRLLNYAYLKYCRSIVTSSAIMLEYIMRSSESMSGRHVPDYFAQVVELHNAKMDLFIGSSKGTTEAERKDFIAYDLTREIELAVKRFDSHPEEEAENLPLINEYVFGKVEPYDAKNIDVIIVLGSRNCSYRVKKGYTVWKENPEIKMILSGGNIHVDGELTEAEFMAEFLRRNNVPGSKIFVENRAQYTKQNLDLTSGIVRQIERREEKEQRVAVVTAGFHMNRVKLMARDMNFLNGRPVTWIQAYGPNTAKDNWYKSPSSISIVMDEMRKTIVLG